jgi:hypothetical protein
MRSGDFSELTEGGGIVTEEVDEPRICSEAYGHGDSFKCKSFLRYEYRRDFDFTVNG